MLHGKGSFYQREACGCPLGAAQRCKLSMPPGWKACDPLAGMPALLKICLTRPIQAALSQVVPDEVQIPDLQEA